jgi:hypothetical protein
MYRIHKWVGVGVGLLLGMWIITGIMAAGGDAERGAKGPRTGPDFSRATLSPAQAVLMALALDSTIAPVGQVVVDRVGSRMVYRLVGAGGRTVLLDAGDGSRVVVDQALAAEIALLDAPKAAMETPTLIERHDDVYRRGPLPVWRVRLGDKEAGTLHVAVATGQLSRVDEGGELHRMAMGLHTFGSLLRIVPSRRAVYLIFVTTSVIALVVVLTGYYLSLPKSWRMWGRGSGG